jgi:hypothetical protein
VKLGLSLGYNKNMNANNIPGTRIGHVYACIAGDHRYASRVEVYVDDDRLNGRVVRLENTAIGGMDGPGGSAPFQVVSQVPIKVTAKSVVDGIKSVMDDTVKSYGKPHKKFSWVGTRETGLSQRLAALAIKHVAR